MAYGSGSVYQRKSDKQWVGKYYVHGKAKLVYARTKKEAREKLRDAILERDSGHTVAGRRQTLTDYLAWWLMTIKYPPHVDIRTHDQYTAVLARVVSRCGHITLDKLRDDHIIAVYAALRKEGKAPATVNDTHRVLKSALKYAVATRRMAYNPLDAVPAPPMRQQEKPRWTAAQLDAFLEQTAGNRWHPLWVTLADTGMRIGEALALRWSDVDEEAGIINLHQALHYGSGQRHTGALKTKNSERPIPMSPTVRAALARRKLDQKKERVKCRDWQDTGLVFTQLNGTILVPSSVRDALMRQAGARGFPPVTTHDLRHLFATRGARQRVHPNVMQKLLGHSHINITLGVYTHVEEEQLREAVDRLSERETGNTG